MLTYVLPIPAQLVVHLVQAEVASAHGQPELFYNAWEDYLVEEDFDRKNYGIMNGEDYSLVSMDAVLNVEPRLEQNYWVLRVVVHKDLGPQRISDAAAMIGVTLTLDQFKSFLTENGKTASVRLDVESNFAKEHFDTWLAELWQRHPPP